MSETKKASQDLQVLDLGAKGVKDEVLIAEFRRIGHVEIVGVEKHEKDSPFIAVTGQPGLFEYRVQGESEVYSFGADTVCKMLKAVGDENPLVSEKARKQIITTPGFLSKLKSARSRH